MKENNFTLIRNDVLANPNISLGAKGLYSLLCYDLTTSIMNLMKNNQLPIELMGYFEELEKYDYAQILDAENFDASDPKLSITVSIL